MKTYTEEEVMKFIKFVIRVGRIDIAALYNEALHKIHKDAWLEHIKTGWTNKDVFETILKTYDL